MAVYWQAGLQQRFLPVVQVQTETKMAKKQKQMSYRKMVEKIHKVQRMSLMESLQLHHKAEMVEETQKIQLRNRLQSLMG